MKQLVIFHFRPVEWYPPIQNALNVLTDELAETHQITLKSCTQNRLPSYEQPRARIDRMPLDTNWSRLKRMLTYVQYALSGLFFLLRKRPSQVMYSENISSFPSFVYKRFLLTNCARE